MDRVKSVIQKDSMSEQKRYAHPNEFISRRFKRRGLKGFYRGMTAQLIRSFPLHAINFLVYENMLTFCRSFNNI